jgi:hypothetical protein
MTHCQALQDFPIQVKYHSLKKTMKPTYLYCKRAENDVPVHAHTLLFKKVYISVVCSNVAQVLPTFSSLNTLKH